MPQKQCPACSATSSVEQIRAGYFTFNCPNHLEFSIMKSDGIFATQNDYLIGMLNDFLNKERASGNLSHITLRERPHVEFSRKTTQGEWHKL